MAREGQGAVKLPSDIDRARIIRLLSVFVSDLEGISGPGEPNYEVCERARAAISGALDELLSGPHLESHPPATKNVETALLDGQEQANPTMGAWDWFGEDADWTNMMDWTNMYTQF